MEITAINDLHCSENIRSSYWQSNAKHTIVLEQGYSPRGRRAKRTERTWVDDRNVHEGNDGNGTNEPTRTHTAQIVKNMTEAATPLNVEISIRTIAIGLSSNPNWIDPQIKQRVTELAPQQRRKMCTVAMRLTARRCKIFQVNLGSANRTNAFTNVYVKMPSIAHVDALRRVAREMYSLQYPHAPRGIMVARGEQPPKPVAVRARLMSGRPIADLARTARPLIHLPEHENRRRKIDRKPGDRPHWLGGISCQCKLTHQLYPELTMIDGHISTPSTEFGRRYGIMNQRFLESGNLRKFSRARGLYGGNRFAPVPQSKTRLKPSQATADKASFKAIKKIFGKIQPAPQEREERGEWKKVVSRGATRVVSWAAKWGRKGSQFAVGEEDVNGRFVAAFRSLVSEIFDRRQVLVPGVCPEIAIRINYRRHLAAYETILSPNFSEVPWAQSNLFFLRGLEGDVPGAGSHKWSLLYHLSKGKNFGGEGVPLPESGFGGKYRLPHGKPMSWFARPITSDLRHCQRQRISAAGKATGVALDRLHPGFSIRTCRQFVKQTDTVNECQAKIPVDQRLTLVARYVDIDEFFTKACMSTAVNTAKAAFGLAKREGKPYLIVPRSLILTMEGRHLKLQEHVQNREATGNNPCRVHFSQNPPRNKKYYGYLTSQDLVRVIESDVGNRFARNLGLLCIQASGAPMGSNAGPAYSESYATAREVAFEKSAIFIRALQEIEDSGVLLLTRGKYIDDKLAVAGVVRQAGDRKTRIELGAGALKRTALHPQTYAPECTLKDSEYFCGAAAEMTMQSTLIKATAKSWPFTRIVPALGHGPKRGRLVGVLWRTFLTTDRITWAGQGRELIESAMRKALQGGFTLRTIRAAVSTFVQKLKTRIRLGHKF